MIPTPVNSVAIPPVYFDLCRGWYDGMDILYAVASTGSLTMGTIRPAGSDTPEKWYLSLWFDLASDVSSARRAAESTGHEDAPALLQFEEWADRTAERLAKEYGLEDWDPLGDTCLPTPLSHEV